MCAPSFVAKVIIPSEGLKGLLVRGAGCGSGVAKVIIPSEGLKALGACRGLSDERIVAKVIIPSEGLKGGGGRDQDGPGARRKGDHPE